MTLYDNPGGGFTGGDHMHDIIGQLASSARNRGYYSCDSRPGASRVDLKVKKKTGPKPKTKYTRCPKCGGMVLAPCIACNPESTYDRKIDSPRVVRPRKRSKPSG